MMFATYIAALIYISQELEGNAFGLVELSAEYARKHAVAYGVVIEAGESWIIYQPHGVTYWVVVPEEDYEAL